MKEYKKYNQIIFKCLISILVFIAVLNYFINPYNIFTQHIFKRTLLKPEAKVQERLTKPLALKFKQEKINTIFVGTSRSDYSITPQYYTNLTNKEAINLAMGDLRVNELIDIIEIALKIHPEIENIYIELNYGMFFENKEHKDYRAEITNNKNLTPTDLGIAFLSFKSTGNAVWSIIKSLSGNKKRTFYSSGEKVIFLNPNIEEDFKNLWGGYVNWNYSKNKTNIIINYVEKLKQQNKNIVFYVYPSHVTEFYFIYKNGQQNNYEQWKKSFTKVAPVYDFQYPNQYTTDEIRPDMNTYFDASHGTYVVGNKIIEDLVNCPKNKCVFARYMTFENADKYNQKNSEDMENWIANNQELVKKLIRR